MENFLRKVIAYVSLAFYYIIAVLIFVHIYYLLSDAGFKEVAQRNISEVIFVLIFVIVGLYLSHGFYKNTNSVMAILIFNSIFFIQAVFLDFMHLGYSFSSFYYSVVTMSPVLIIILFSIILAYLQKFRGHKTRH